ncbi:MAG: acyltransferase [Desulfuromonadales bacterium]|nr:acyltransferase [Desulfuromonadales bacterium]
MIKMIFFFRRFLEFFKISYLKYIYKNKLKLGSNCKIESGTKVQIILGHVRLGDNVVLRSSPYRYHAGMPFRCTVLADEKEAEINIGDNCRINGAYIHAKSSIKIGNNCVIASGVNILDSNGHEVFSGNRTVGQDRPEGIIIGDNVWIGINAVVLKGTKIGRNSILSANSVAKGIFPDNSLISGNPAKLIKKLEIP